MPLQFSSNQHTECFFQENAYEDVVCNITAFSYNYFYLCSVPYGPGSWNNSPKTTNYAHISELLSVLGYNPVVNLERHTRNINMCRTQTCSSQRYSDTYKNWEMGNQPCFHLAHKKVGAWMSNDIWRFHGNAITYSWPNLNTLMQHFNGLMHNSCNSWHLWTHWGRATHICIGKLTIIGSDNGLSPGRRQAIIWTITGILVIVPLGTNFNEILIQIHTFSFQKMHFKMFSAKWRPFCLGLNVT